MINEATFDVGYAVTARYAAEDFSITDSENGEWGGAEPIRITKYWSGEKAPDPQHFEARLLWSDQFFYVRFDAELAEPLIISGAARPARTMNLWEKDVVEIFLAPDCGEPRRYFEFEIAPTGEWLDLAIDATDGERKTDWEYDSGMETAAFAGKAQVTMAMKIPWRAFGCRPLPGEYWLGNIFRCAGSEANRSYLAWQPTMTEKPNFHVPECFGKFYFEGIKKP